MLVIGNNPYGFRFPSIFFGAMMILTFYLLVRKLGNPTVALIAAFLLSFDNLVFVHSRIATLDIFVVAFMVLGFYWYFDGKKTRSAFAMALATLSKISGALGFLAIALYHLLRSPRIVKDGAIPTIKERSNWLEDYALAYGLSFLGILTVLDRFWGGYTNPIDHLSFILGYTRGLSRGKLEGAESYPWQWFLNEVKIPYLSVNVIVDGKVERSTVAFLGAMNPLIIYLCIPVMVYMAYKVLWNKDSVALFVLTWFSATYLPYLPMWFLWQRISYIFYFLNTLPALALGIAYMLVDQRPPRIVVIAYLAAVLVGFYLLFPFKTIPQP